MSWKSLVTAGLFCVLASPAFAAPSGAVVSTNGTTGTGGSSGHLDTNGNWIWTVQVTPDLTLVPDTTGTPVAIEAGFKSTSAGAGTVTIGANSGKTQGDVISAARNPVNGVGSFDTLNPGSTIFGSWQTTTNGLIDTASNNRPTGVQLNAPGVGATAGSSYTTNSSVSGAANEVFAALGSVNFTTAGAKDVMNIVALRPSVTTGNIVTTTSIQVKGVYGTGSTNGRLTQITGGTAGGPYTTGNTDNFSGTYTMTAKGGDADLNGTDNAADFLAVQNHLFVTPPVAGWTWADGDFDGNGQVNAADFLMMQNNFLVGSFNYSVGPTFAPGSGSSDLSGVGVPEPASAALLALALVGSLGMIRRKR